MAGKESWDSARVKSVFNTWRELIPQYQPGFLGRTWQEGGTSLANKKTGMYVLGSFVGIQFTDPKAAKDLDFFAFPSINNKWGHDSVEAPIDGFLLSRSPKNEDGAKALLAYLGSKAAADTWLGIDHSIVGANKRTSQANYTVLQKKSAALIAGAKHISQYMDRDTRPDFASTVMIPALQQFLNKPNDVNSLVKSIEKQKKAIFTS
jgi:multiple sugar transport system substrate-binding protein